MCRQAAFGIPVVHRCAALLSARLGEHGLVVAAGVAGSCTVHRKKKQGAAHGSFEIGRSDDLVAEASTWMWASHNRMYVFPVSTAVNTVIVEEGIGSLVGVVHQRGLHRIQCLILVGFRN